VSAMVGWGQVSRGAGANAQSRTHGSRHMATVTSLILKSLSNGVEPIKPHITQLRACDARD